MKKTLLSVILALAMLVSMVSAFSLSVGAVMPAATIRDGSYTTIAEAVSDAQNGDVIKLQKDVNENSILIPESLTVTIDLNGYTVSGSETIFTIEGNVEITDTSAGRAGRIVSKPSNTEDSGFAVYVYPSAVVTLNGISIRTEGYASNNYCVSTYGTLNITGGCTLEANTAGDPAVQVGCVLINEGTTTIEEAELYATGGTQANLPVGINAGTLNITGNEVYLFNLTTTASPYCGAIAILSGEANIYGGYYVGGLMEDGGNLNIVGKSYFDFDATDFCADDFGCKENNEEETSETYPYVTERVYAVTEATCAGGSVSVGETKKFFEGEEVTLSYTANGGYQFDSYSAYITDGGDEVTVTDGKFTMPAADVTVEAFFKAITPTPVIDDEEEIPQGTPDEEPVQKPSPKTADNTAVILYVLAAVTVLCAGMVILRKKKYER